MTYEENVRKAATEMFKSDWEEWEINEAGIRGYYKSARIAVRLQAEAVREFMKPYRSDGFVTNLLVEHGLIPTPECQHHYIMCGYNEFKCEFCGQKK